MSVRGRPVNFERRAQLLDAIVEHVMAHGLAGLSMRPLAQAAGCDPTVLAHHFGSKDEIVALALNEVRARLRAVERDVTGSPAERIRVIWAWCTEPSREPLYRLFFEAYGLALQQPGRYASFLDTVVTDWLEQLRTETDPATATLVIAAIRGLLLDLLTTGDHERTGAAVEQLALAVA